MQRFKMVSGVPSVKGDLGDSTYGAGNQETEQTAFATALNVVKVLGHVVTVEGLIGRFATREGLRNC